VTFLWNYCRGPQLLLGYSFDILLENRNFKNVEVIKIFGENKNSNQHKSVTVVMLYYDGEPKAHEKSE